MSEINKTYSHFEVLPTTMEVAIENETVTSAMIKCQQVSTIQLNEEEVKMHRRFSIAELAVVNSQLAEIAKVKP